MKTIFGVKNLKKSRKKTVVAIGVFDGVHKGHIMVIKKVVKEARDIKAKAAVLTFDPHPLYVLHPVKRPPRIMSLTHKLSIFKELGVDICVVVKFDKRFANITPQRFVKGVLVDKLNVSKIFVGENFVFGKGKKGTLSALKKLGKKYNFSVKVIKTVKSGKTAISSSLIRHLISKGNLAAATKLLNRLVSVLGTVIKGDRRGRIIGYPTANINPHHEVIPHSGVYAVKIKLQNKEFSGILNIGKRPTFKSEEGLEPTIEVHMFNFNKDIYGRDLEISFIKKIRDERRFPNQEALIKQIRKDQKKAKEILW